MKKKPQFSEQADKVQPEKPRKRKSKFIDFFVTIFFLSTAVISINLFRQDLFQTLESFDKEPVGIIIIKNNVVQRRHIDRTLWDRLLIESPVYPGDVVRTADLSAATVYLDENQINMNENTLVRIQNVFPGSGLFQIELEEGNISLISGQESSGLILNMMGRQVVAASGTALDAQMGNEGLVVQVSEGSAVFIEEGKEKQLDEGSVIAKDSSGEDRVIPAAVMFQPQPNARFLKVSTQPLEVKFSWKKFNVDAGEALKFEIAMDKNFKKSLQVKENLDNDTQVNLQAGLWYWRLSCNGIVLCKGQLTITDTAGPQLLSPVNNAVFRYNSDLPNIRFQWQKNAAVSQYILQISDNINFADPKVNIKIPAAFHIQSDIGQGIWYWRVQPVFVSAYESVELYSDTASFKIEQNSDTALPAIDLPVKPAAARTENVVGNFFNSIKVSLETIKKPEAQKNTTAGDTAKAFEKIKAPVVTSERPVQGRNYTIVRGDTLNQIAWDAYGFFYKWRLIADWNNIPNPNLIEIGDVYFIPIDN